MTSGRDCVIVELMATYPVLWHEEGSPDVWRGRAELDGYGLALHGRTAEAEDRLFIPDRDLAEVARGRDAAIGPCEAIRVRTRQGLSLLLAVPFGVGLLTELFEHLAVRAAAAA